MNNTTTSLPSPVTAGDAKLAQRLVLLALVLAVAGCAALSIDFLAGWVFLGEAGPIWAVLRKGFKRLVNPAETFANGLGIILILLTLLAADVAYRRGLVRAVVVIFGAGILVNVGKGLLARTRPKELFDKTADRFDGNVFASFGEWLPLWKLGYAGQSFPSGHTATAVALAIVLCRRWPHASWAFITLASFAGLQRVAFGHHYPSDCLWGAAVACLFAAVCYHPSLGGRLFGRLEGNLPRATTADAKAAVGAEKQLAA